ncbi:hypothetical protein A1332_08305 [Methylomonas methanica]|jgi:hypothetical protein|uniref:Beta-barrel porin 2 n=1 Tax=Methylomonas methanica TaxID=421 RepID=A0A177MTB3_METMH|nr:hypothetical protein A1332_08305 [Methylomonas methanica]
MILTLYHKHIAIIDGSCLKEPKQIFLSGCFLLSLYSVEAAADYHVELSNRAFYTDDVALFTVTRQLSLLDDPTQPAVDRPSGRSDFIYEPTASVLLDLPENFGDTTFFAEAGGYVFAENTDFTHANFQTAVSRQFESATTVSAIYRFVPDRLLGFNMVEQEFGDAIEGNESLTSHIWSIHVEQELTAWLAMHVLGRYGLRDYDGVFKHRSTDLWTLGTHFAIELTEDIELFLGYHFEVGNARNQRSIALNDDASYQTHYASIEIETKLSEKIKLAVDFDFEKNCYTTMNRLDEHFGNPEEIFLGGIELRYALSKESLVTLGLEHGNRQKRNEFIGFHNNNLWLGISHNF